MGPQRIRLVIFQMAPASWIVRGLEHDIVAEGRTIGGAVRAAVRFIEAQTAFDIRHAHAPLSVFPPASQRYWNAFAAGTAVSIDQLGIVPPAGWDVHAAFATRLPTEGHVRRSPFLVAQTMMG
ncbi:MAG TPA: hypothetical protein VFA27_02580 [Vicinamibacterales bacterium]|nr:hypothetical protein [Vicinamibacterales bacterium]